MVKVFLTPEAQADSEHLPPMIQARVQVVLERLLEWPNVSGAKPLQYQWKGHFRIRTGDWRVIFKEVRPNLLVVRIKHRRDVYED